MKPIQTKHELQFDYFSENYHQFETDFLQVGGYFYAARLFRR